MDNSSDDKTELETHLGWGIDSLNRDRGDEYLSVKLYSVHEYLEYLADHLDYRRLRFEVPKDLSRRFETVGLFLRHVVKVFPEQISSQVEGILNDNDLQTTVGVLSNLQSSDIRMLRLRSRLVGIFGFLRALTPDDYTDITPKKAFEAKVALQRLAQVALYASSLDTTDHEMDDVTLAGHYDTASINKQRVLALVTLLRGECERLPESLDKIALHNRIDNLEKELKRQSPRWMRVIAISFALLAVLADLKTMDPTIFASAHGVAQQIVSVLHFEGMASNKSPLLPYDSMPSDIPMLPAPPLRMQNPEEKTTEDDL